MARFAMVLRHLPRLEYESAYKVQLAVIGALPTSWEQCVGGSSSSSGLSSRPDRREILQFQADISDLARRSAEIQSRKRSGEGR